MQDPDCIFCKIVAGEIPAEKTYEDEHAIAFLDISPQAPGHTLVVPKEHYRWFYEMPDDLYAHIFSVVKKLAPELKEKHSAGYTKVGIVGTEVPHTHIHLIPRQLTDDPIV